MHIYLALIAAVLVQPLVLILRFIPSYILMPSQQLFSSGIGPVIQIIIIVIVVAAAAVLFLGIPTFLLLRKFNCINWTSLAISGFSLGAIPIAISWPEYREGYSAGSSWYGKLVETYIKGEPTTYAWYEYFANVFFYGLHGLIGALAFYAVWRRLDKRNKHVGK